MCRKFVVNLERLFSQNKIGRFFSNKSRKPELAKRRAHGEGSIYLRIDGLWVGQIPLPSGKKKYKYAKTQKEAKDWLQ